MRGRYARSRRRPWARRGWAGQCACLEEVLDVVACMEHILTVAMAEPDVPGAVWRRGCVDMTAVLMGPTEDGKQRELLEMFAGGYKRQ
jgi:hypothetical protein